MTIGVLGGGLSGCVLGKLFTDMGWKFEVLEAEPEIGGLMRSETKDGYTYDTGGPHIIFSKNKVALDFLLKTVEGNISTRKRNTKILYKGGLVKYPFENGFSDLPLADNLACLASFTKAKLASRMMGEKAKAANFQEWCAKAFGKGMARRYLVPYNEKIWKHPLRDMSTGWVERIPSPPWKDVLKSSMGVKTEGYVHQSVFHYPTVGGIQSVIEGLTKGFTDRFTTGFRVDLVEKAGSEWNVTGSRGKRTYDSVISTIPLPTLAEVAGFPADIKARADALQVNSVATILLGGISPKHRDISWLYIPSKDVLTHRASFLSNYSDKVAPQGKMSLIADITCRHGDDIWTMDDRDITERTVRDLVSCGVLENDSVEATAVARHRFAYVIDDLARKDNLAAIQGYTHKEGLFLLGRFGEYEYLNMDAIVERCMSFVDRNRQQLEQAGRKG